MIRYFDEIDHPLFECCLDVGHATLVREDAAAFIQALGKKRLTCLHVHDVDDAHDRHLPPYFGGAIAWDRVIDALAEIGYEGNFTYEADYFFQGRPPEIAPAAARLMASIGHTLIKRLKARTAKKNKYNERLSPLSFFLAVADHPRHFGGANAPLRTQWRSTAKDTTRRYCTKWEIQAARIWACRTELPFAQSNYNHIYH